MQSCAQFDYDCASSIQLHAFCIYGAGHLNNNAIWPSACYYTVKTTVCCCMLDAVSIILVYVCSKSMSEWLWFCKSIHAVERLLAALRSQKLRPYNWWWWFVWFKCIFGFVHMQTDVQALWTVFYAAHVFGYIIFETTLVQIEILFTFLMLTSYSYSEIEIKILKRIDIFKSSSASTSDNKKH